MLKYILFFIFVTRHCHCQSSFFGSEDINSEEYNFGDDVIFTNYDGANNYGGEDSYGGNNYGGSNYGTFGGDEYYENSGEEYGDETSAEGPSARGTYALTIKTRYKGAFKDDKSAKFESLAGDITRDLSAYLSRELATPRDDFKVEILSFEPEPSSRKRKTRATVDVEFLPDTDVTSEQLTNIMLSFVDTGNVGGKRVTDVTEIILDVDSTDETLPDDTVITDTTGAAPVDYNVVITYERPFNRRLSDVTSSAFQKEKRAVEGEVNLFLVAGGTISPVDVISVNVVEFQRMSGGMTGAFMTISLTNSPPQLLDNALQDLVGENLRRRRISSAELNGLPTSSTTVTSREATPPPLSGGDDYEDDPAPTDPSVSAPPNRGDSEESLPPAIPVTNEPTPPPLGCRKRPPIDNGDEDCSASRFSSSIVPVGQGCSYFCNAGFRLNGASYARCQFNGAWSEPSPSCEEILCQPNLENEELLNGRLSCTDDNRIGSQCSVSCAQNYRLRAELPVRECQANGEWDGSTQTCELISIDCVIDYRPWTECRDGYRYRYGYVVQEAQGTGKPCLSPVPYKEEECQDCEIIWGEWGVCSNEQRNRSEVVLLPPVGVGEPCPELSFETERCRDCVLEWGEWSDCSSTGFETTRTQYVAIEPIGNGGKPCLPLQTERKPCRDCTVVWGSWEPCSNGIRVRHEYITVRPMGAGKECPPLQRDEEVCVDCQVEWGSWSECEANERSRSQEVTAEAVGAGAACPQLQTETEACADCVIEWEEWSECSNGSQSRSQSVVTREFAGGAPCPELETESEACVDCQIGWGEWSVCSGGQRSRSEEVVAAPMGVGEPCPPNLQTESEPCVHCELSWNAWSECAGGERQREQYISVQPVGNAGIPCLPLQTETEVCIDCVVEWGEWGECHDFERERSLEIIVEPVGNGAKECPHLHSESQDCYDCELAWDAWSDCVDGKRRRVQYPLVEPEGGGKECEYAPDQVEVCTDCIVEWGDWGECIAGQKTRKQEIVFDRVGAGRPCPFLQTEMEDCTNCLVEWGDWSVCSDGLRRRSQYVVEGESNGGTHCPRLLNDEEICIDCEVRWADWSVCTNGERIRFQYISMVKEGAGNECPELQNEREVCEHCEVVWDDWEACRNGRRSRTEKIIVNPVGAGDACPALRTESEACVDCVVEWRGFGGCVNGQMSRSQVVTVQPVGAGRECPSLQIDTQVCADCVVQWTEWSDCVDNRRSRNEEVIVESVGTGLKCPENLEGEAESCGDRNETSLICRYTREFLGYGGNRNKRDILLLGDESGSIGWINYEKIKDHFKAIAHQIRGGLGRERAQIAMMSFAGWTRTQFGFDKYTVPNEMSVAIGKSRYHGGHRSKIGQALSEANTWMFQQAEGMRSFPGKDDDDITHEILIATDGCRTSSGYYLQKGLKLIRRRGIKLYVLGIDSHDPRCKEALREMADGQTILYEVGDWNAVDDFTRSIERKVCQP